MLDGLEQLAPTHDVSGVFVADFDGRISDCVRRLVQLLDAPRAIPILVPAIMFELSYWLLSGPIGGDVATVVFGVDWSPSVVAAIHELRERFTETIRIDELAMNAGMSPSSFLRIFKAMTSVTPLQYQKQLRLLKARNLMMDDATNAETAAYRVGYESPSQFSREYARMFGAPPHQDVARAGSARSVAPASRSSYNVCGSAWLRRRFRLLRLSDTTLLNNSIHTIFSRLRHEADCAGSGLFGDAVICNDRLLRRTFRGRLDPHGVSY